MKLRNLSEFSFRQGETGMPELSNEGGAIEASYSLEASQVAKPEAPPKSWCRGRDGKPIEFGYPWVEDEF